MDRLRYQAIQTVVIFLLALFTHTVSDASRAEDRLQTALFDGYNMFSRPVENHTDVLNVYLGVAICQLIEVDQKNEKVVLSMWLKLGWVDYRLAWNESDYDGIRNINLPRTKMWTPDIVLYNRVEQESTDGDEKFLIPVYSDGSSYDCPLKVVTARCSIDIKWFPFDDQFCTLVYESWAHDATMLNITLYSDGNELQHLQPNCEWDIREVQSYRYEKKFEHDNPPVISVVFKLHLSRKVLYYAVNLILPCALISFLTPLSFLIPIEAGDRIGLGITILLAMSVYQIIVLDKIPTSSEGIPVIGSYFIVLISLNAIAIVLMIFIVNLHQPTTKPMPRWARSFVLKYLSKLLRMSKPPSSDETKKQYPLTDAHLQLCGHCEVNLNDRSTNTATLNRNAHVSNGCEAVSAELEGLSPCCESYSTQRRESRMEERRSSPEDIDDWKFTALVMERACVVFFGSFQLLCSLVLALFIFKKLANANYQQPTSLE